MFELSHELPNDSTLTKLGNFKKIPKTLGVLGTLASTPPETQKGNFNSCAKNIPQNILFLTSFVNLSTPPRPRMQPIQFTQHLANPYQEELIFRFICIYEDMVSFMCFNSIHALPVIIQKVESACRRYHIKTNLS